MNVRYNELSQKVLDKIDKACIRQPLKVVLDTQARLDISKYQIFSEGKTLLVVGTKKEQEYLTLEVLNENVSKLYLPIKDKHIDLDALLKYLGQQQIRHVFIEAGQTLVSAFINQNFVDELYAFVAPKLLGKSSRAAFAINDIQSLDKVSEYRLHKVKQYNNDVMLHYVKDLKINL